MDKQAFPLVVRELGRCDYQHCFDAMKHFTMRRDAATVDEIWLLEHPPVFTLGLNGKREHIIQAGDIPVVQSDRGGQVTFHGPGQLVVYLLLDLFRMGTGIHQMVSIMEQGIMALLKDLGIHGHTRENAPGVYVAGNKIASLGLRVRRGRCYHGLSLNVDMDLTPFTQINPCGLAGLEVTDLHALGGPTHPHKVAPDLIRHLIRGLGYQGDYPWVSQTLAQHPAFTTTATDNLAWA